MPIRGPSLLVSQFSSGCLRIGPTAPADRVDPNRAALFLDRDGTLIEHRTGHVRRVEDIKFLPGVLAALRRLGAAGFPIVITSNQSVVSRGFLSTSEVVPLHRQVLADIEAAGARVDISFLCPHQPSDGCGCRKPQLAMYRAGARELGRRMSAAFVVGDAVCDVMAGIAMGTRPVLVRTGLGETTVKALADDGTLDHSDVVDSFPALADRLLAGDCRGPHGRSSFPPAY